MKKLPGLVILIVLASVIFAGCGPVTSQQTEKGTLRFYANGEDFVRQGFVSKDGWSISFNHVYVTLTEITGYQTDPPYDPHSGSEIQYTHILALDKARTVDLAQGGEDALPILVVESPSAPVGHYNALAWKMIPAADGPSAGYSLVMVGQAEKNGRSIDFTIKVEKEFAYTCGEYVGDERKGFLDQDSVADLDMTFHFDHVFGDADTPPDDALNANALGFEPLAEIAEGGSLNVDMAVLQARLSAQDYQTLADILPTLGHAGEGHCHSEVH